MDKAHTIRPNLAKAPESETIRQNVAHVVQDLAVLTELQGQLFRSDAGEIMERIARPLAILTVSVLLLAATAPVCLLAIAEGLVAAGVPRAGAYALVTAASMAIAAGMALWAWRRFRGAPRPFARSREELIHNLAWIKTAVENLAGNPEQRGSDAQDACNGHGATNH
jgi:membrane protein implicated in regulation of membrane protease activity